MYGEPSLDGSQAGAVLTGAAGLGEAGCCAVREPAKIAANIVAQGRKATMNLTLLKLILLTLSPANADWMKIKPSREPDRK
jgi:hypothetical protein